MRECIEKISNFIDEHKEEMIDFWRNIVNLESSAREKANVDILAEYLKSEFEKEGLECRLVEVGPDNGKSLIGVLGNGINKEPVIFSGHIDTVFSKGSFGDKPFRIEGGKAYGPGVLDMKGGVVITLFIIKALRNIGYKERPIKIVLLADEEKGHQNASTPELLMTETKGGLCAFNMETGLIDNSLCVGRKGGGVCYVTVKGKEAHAGNDYLIGRNAIEEAANKIIDIQKLTDLNQDTTVSVTIVKGGSVQNSIPV